MRQQRWGTNGDWQETDLDTGWTIRERMTLQEGRRVVSELAIVPSGRTLPRGGTTARLLRQVKVGQVARGLHRSIATYFGAAAVVLRRRDA